MKRYFLLALFFSGFLFSGVHAEEGHTIEFNIKNYKEKEILIAYYFGDKQLIKDTLQITDQNNFILQGKEKLAPGVYLLILMPEKEWIQFLVSDQDQHFYVELDAKDLTDLKFAESEDNDVFLDYINFLGDKRKEATALNEKLSKADSLSTTYDKILKQLENLDEEVFSEQERIVKEYPDYISKLIIKANFEVDVPQFEGEVNEVQLKRYHYYKDHYFDHLEMDNPASLRTPFFYQKIKNYLDKLTVQHPDSINIALDIIFEKLSPAEESFRYYLSHLLNSYAKSKVVGFDAVYVHLVLNYYARGKAPWMDEESLAKMVNEARLTKPLLIGKTAPDFTTFLEDSTEITLSKIEADYVVLVFWAPDCGHCKKAIPHVVEFADKFKNKGVKVVSICNKRGKEVKGCWEGIKDKDMERLINTADENDKSRIRYKYYVKTTPLIYILDSNREILIKKIGAEQLEAVMDEIIQYHKEEQVK